jgi:membrane protein involved in colicin uptake
MGGFKKLMTSMVGSVGRVLGFAPTAQAPSYAMYQTGGSQLDQAAALQQMETDKLRRAELERQAEAARQKTEETARAADEKKKLLAAEEARRKANVASSGRASTILAGENAPAKSLLGA